MTLINTGVISEAIAAEFPNLTTILQLGVIDKNTDLVGKGAGQTITMTQFLPLSEELQVLEKGDAITFEELSQVQKTVGVEHFGAGVMVYDQDVNYVLSGGKLEATAAQELTRKFAKAFDRKAYETLEQTTIPAIDATAGLSDNLILSNILKHFGEEALDITQAVLVPSVVAEQLLNEAITKNFVKASEVGYQATYRNEIGKLFNKIPVIMSDRVRSEEKDGERIYKSLVIPKGALTYVLSQDVSTESTRDIEYKRTRFASNCFYGMALMRDTLVFDTKPL